MSQGFPFEHFLKQNNTNPNKISFLDQQTPPDKLTDSFESSELTSINGEIENYLKNIVPNQKFTAYFENNFTLINITNDYIEFSVTTPFIKSILEGHYINIIKEAVLNILGKQYLIKIDINKSNKSLSSNNTNILNTLSSNSNSSLNNSLETKPRNVKEAKFILPTSLVPTKNDLNLKVESKYLDHISKESDFSIIDHNKTFDNFIVGPSNNLAYATAKAVSNNPGKSGKYPSLYVYSSSGLGKTHLLHAVANGIREQYPNLIICLITARDFIKEMINSIQKNDMSSFQRKYSEKIDVLMIDDIHELKNKKGTQNEFFHVFNELHNRGKQLIFTSDKSPDEIDGIEERIKTRLQWGLVLDIQKPDLETRIAILKRKAYELDLYIPDDILNLIACSIKNSIRELEGSLVKLSAYTDVMKVEIDTEIVKDLLNLESNDESKTHTLDTIAKACSQQFKVHIADLKSKTRSKDITTARHVAMYLSHKILGATLQEIGKFYGGRDHTSVIHAIRKIKDLLKSDSNLSKDIILVENLL